MFAEVKVYEVKAYKKCKFFGPPCIVLHPHNNRNL